jgi:hypothetical protein
MTPIWQATSGPPWPGWEHGNWAHGGPWEILPAAWAVPAFLILVLAARLALLLPRHWPAHHRLRLYPPVSPARPPGPVLASDADRENTAQILSAAIAEGRLSHDEGVDRIGKAYMARHIHELSAIAADLPAGPPLPPYRLATRSVRLSAAVPVLICCLLLLAAAGAGLALSAWL